MRAVPVFLYVLTRSGSVTGFSSYHTLHKRALATTSLQSIESSIDGVESNSEGAKSSSSSCPFSMTYQRYRIDLSGGKSDDAVLRPNIISNMRLTIQRSNLERKYSQITDSIFWCDTINPKVDSDDDDTILLGKMGIQVSAKFWEILSNMIQQMEGTTPRISVLAFPNASKVMVNRLVDISNWIDTQQSTWPYTSNCDLNKFSIRAEVDDSSDVPSVIVTCYARDNDAGIEKLEGYEPDNSWDSSIIERRTKAWVDRVLVKQKICPFTRSNSKSGQGLSDVHVPVGNIQYDLSRARSDQIYLLMADTWSSIERMITAGPSGKNGVSSILLSAPEFDNEFKLWGEVIFAILEANVSAAKAEPVIGVVCFHPLYATPDGSSWPGFGHMHSSIRLRKWLEEENNELSNQLTDEEIAAGGAIQRRTPHSCINVLRSEQLEAAESKRSTRELYATNIKTLYETGFSTLEKDLRDEQSLL